MLKRTIKGIAMPKVSLVMSSLMLLAIPPGAFAVTRSGAHKPAALVNPSEASPKATTLRYTGKQVVPRSPDLFTLDTDIPRVRRTLPVSAPVVVPVDVVKKVRRPATHVVRAEIEQWHDLALSVGWTEAEWPKLSCIMWRESRGIAAAKNRHSSASGLLQILASHFHGVDLFDPATNLATGRAMFNLRHWGPWASTVNGC